MTQDELSSGNRQAHDAWEQNAAFWDEKMGEGNDFVELLIWPEVARLLDVQPGQRVLDVACGNGLYARRLAALGAKMVAFDFSENMIAHAKQRPSDGIAYHVCDATDEAALLRLGEGAFDAAVCNMALFDMAKIEPLFRALGKLLKPGGHFVFSVTHPCFNNANTTMVAELEDCEGEFVTVYSVKVSGYMTPTVKHGAALAGQPVPQPYFDRPLHVQLNTAFAAGFVLDALEERAFPPDGPQKHPMMWGGHFSEIPPVMIARVRLA